MNNRQLHHYLKIGSAIAFIIMITVNVLASSLPINGMSTGEISNIYNGLFTPAGLTFSIWGVIYIALLLYTIYQTGGIWKHTPQQANLINQIGGLYILSCLANAAWILCWHYQKLLFSVVVMVFLLILLILIYSRIRKSLKTAATRNLKMYVLTPFSLYLGWISVATIANISAFLISIDWSRFGLSPSVWTVVMMLAAVFITLMMQRYYRDLVFTAVVFWAFLGILIQHITVYEMKYTLVMVADVFCMAAMLIGVVFVFTSNKKVRRSVARQKTSKKRSRK